MKYIDLHVHTMASDGTDSPEQLVTSAASLGLAAVAVTDHDCLLSCEDAMRAGEKLGVEVVPGIEISTKFRSSVHILGYYPKIDHPELRQVIDWEISDRDRRNEKMVELIRADGVGITYQEMKERFGDVVGRPHFAQVLVEAGKASDIPDAFAKYVCKGAKYWVPRSFLSLEESISIIIKAGGLPVLAHPFEYKLDDTGLRELIERCLDSGLRGMECRYSGYTAEQCEYLEALAEEFGLLKTGGSDYHGSRKPNISLGSGTGDLKVPYEYLSRLKEAVGK